MGGSGGGGGGGDGGGGTGVSSPPPPSPAPPPPSCPELDKLIDLLTLPSGQEWCNSDPRRSNSKEVCEGAYLAWPDKNDPSKTVAQWCFHDPARNKCKLARDTVSCSRAQGRDPPPPPPLPPPPPSPPLLPSPSP